MTLQNMPFVPARWFDNSGNALAGGYLWFYLRGTSTPATGSLWRNADRSAAWTNPVQLDGAGHADILLDPGAYTVVMKDYTGAQVLPPVDITQGGGEFGSGVGGTAIMVPNYAAARALTTAYDAVYVLGRTTEGDGGEGWFQNVLASTETDDDGAILVAGAIRYRRILNGSLSPRWYGVVYGSNTSQDAPLAKALTAAGTGRRALPLLVEGSIYLGIDTTIVSGVAIRFAEAGRFVAGVDGVVMTFQAGALIDGTISQAFGVGVQPEFPAGFGPARLSWMGGVTGDDRLKKLSLCSNNGVSMIDADASISTDIAFPLEVLVEPAGGTITVTSACNLVIPTVAQDCRAPWIATPSASASTGIKVGSLSGARLAWFSGAGASVACLSAGFVRVAPGDSLVVATALTLPQLLLHGDGCNPASDGLSVTAAGALTISGRLYASKTRLQVAAGGALTAGSWACDGATISGVGPWGNAGSGYANVYDGKPSLRHAMLPLLSGSKMIGVDGAGEIVQASDSPSFNDLSIFGGMYAPVHAITYSQSIDNPLKFIYVARRNSSGSAITITLPSVGGANEGVPNMFMIFPYGSGGQIILSGPMERGDTSTTLIVIRPMVMLFNSASNKWDYLG